jgi:hypothetical protein
LAEAAEDRRFGQGCLGGADAAVAAAGGGEQVAGAGAGADAVFVAAPQHQRGPELRELAGVGGGGLVEEGGGGPADRLDAGDVQAELAGEGGVAMLLWRSSRASQR